VKNQSPGHVKKVKCSSTFMACLRAFRRTKNAQVRQLQRKLSNVRSTRAGKLATAMENGLKGHNIGLKCNKQVCNQRCITWKFKPNHRYSTNGNI
jgi:hypothetical protein